MKRGHVTLLALVAALALAQELLGRALCAWGFGGALLSMGAHTPAWVLASGLLFLVLRVAVALLGPGVLAAIVVDVAMRRLLPTDRAAAGHLAARGQRWRRRAHG